MTVDVFPYPGLQERVVARCAELLGPCTVDADLSMPLAEAYVLALTYGDGQRCVAKAARQDKHHRRELHAYREWVPALGDRAPALLAHDDALRLLVLSWVPGRAADQTGKPLTPEVYAQAGRLTRLLHDSAAPVTDPSFAERLTGRLDEYVNRGGRLLSPADVAFARDRVREVATLPSPATVPCHGDNQPRNWVIDDAGRVGMIDFGRAERDIWIQDASRMYFRHWPDRPDLQRAFFDGYGRQPGAADWSLLRGYAAYSALSTVVWAREHDDAEFEAEGRTMLERLRNGDGP